jgi:hypothetical protein
MILHDSEKCHVLGACCFHGLAFLTPPRSPKPPYAPSFHAHACLASAGASLPVVVPAFSHSHARTRCLLAAWLRPLCASKRELRQLRAPHMLTPALAVRGAPRHAFRLATRPYGVPQARHRVRRGPAGHRVQRRPHPRHAPRRAGPQVPCGARIA